MTEQNLIERSWAVYEKHMRERGVSTDEGSFVGGFATCYGILTGRIDIGLSQDTKVVALFDRVQEELDAILAKIIEAHSGEQYNGG